jgi:hypothetical protein
MKLTETHFTQRKRCDGVISTQLWECGRSVVPIGLTAPLGWAFLEAMPGRDNVMRCVSVLGCHDKGPQI